MYRDRFVSSIDRHLCFRQHRSPEQAHNDFEVRTLLMQLLERMPGRHESLSVPKVSSEVYDHK